MSSSKPVVASLRMETLAGTSEEPLRARLRSTSPRQSEANRHLLDNIGIRRWERQCRRRSRRPNDLAPPCPVRRAVPAPTVLEGRIRRMPGMAASRSRAVVRAVVDHNDRSVRPTRRGPVDAVDSVRGALARCRRAARRDVELHVQLRPPKRRYRPCLMASVQRRHLPPHPAAGRHTARVRARDASSSVGPAASSPSRAVAVVVRAAAASGRRWWSESSCGRCTASACGRGRTSRRRRAAGAAQRRRTRGRTTSPRSDLLAASIVEVPRVAPSPGRRRRGPR